MCAVPGRPYRSRTAALSLSFKSLHWLQRHRLLQQPCDSGFILFQQELRGILSSPVFCSNSIMELGKDISLLQDNHGISVTPPPSYCTAMGTRQRHFPPTAKPWDFGNIFFLLQQQLESRQGLTSAVIALRDSRTNGSSSTLSCISQYSTVVLLLFLYLSLPLSPHYYESIAKYSTPLNW